MSYITQCTIIKRVNSDEVTNEIQQYVSRADENNLDLVVRSLIPIDDKYELIVDFKKKVKYDIQINELKSVSDIVKKIDELKKKKGYWLDQVNNMHGEISDEEHFRHLSERQHSHFEGAIHALEHILGQSEI